MKKLSTLILCVFGLISLSLGQGKITPALRQATNQNNLSKTPVIITLANQYDASAAMRQTAFLNRQERADYVMSELQAFSSQSQQDLLALMAEAGDQVSEVHPFWIFNGISCQATPAFIEILAQRADVACIDYDEEFSEEAYEATEGEPSRDIRWNLAHIRADEVWTYNGSSGYTGAGVVVAIIDSGIRYNHQELQTHMWNSTNPNIPNHGWNFVVNVNDPYEAKNLGNGHGTAVAGIVAGTSTGVAPGAQLMALKVSNSQGGGITETNICAAIEFAVTNGADIVVITANEVGVGAKAAYRDKMVNLLALGKVAVTNAGDNGQSHLVPNSIAAPSNCPSPWHNPDETMNGGRSANICVGNTDNQDYKTANSSIGPVTWAGIGSYNDYPYTAGNPNQAGHIRPDLTAPGVQVTTTGYTSNSSFQSITSSIASAAHVAGVAALLLEANPELTPEQIDQILETSAIKCEGLATKNNYYGAGRVDAYEAMTTLKATVNAPANLNATATANIVNLTWNASSGASSYQLFCNEECIAQNLTTTSFTHTTTVGGNHVYYVKAVQANGKTSGKSNQKAVFVDPAGPVVTGLAATVSGPQLNNVSLSWQPATPLHELSYFSEAVGFSGAGTSKYFAQRYTTEQLVAVAGHSIDSLSFFVNENGQYTFSIHNGNPNGPNEQLYTKTLTINTTPGSWYTFKLNSPVHIDHTKDLWIVCRAANSISNPASYAISSNPTGFGSLASTDGKNWERTNTQLVWMLRAILTGDTYTYNVQRDGTTIASNLSNPSYNDNGVAMGPHDYTVTTNYNNHQNVSFPCDPLRVNIQTRFVVTFVPGGGTCSTTSMQQTGTNAPITLPTAVPSNACQQEGYVFAGWAETAVEGTTEAPQLFAAGSAYVPANDLSLYAVYKKAEGVTGWNPARTINIGDSICIVSPDLSVELDDFDPDYGYITSAAFNENIQALHPFTVHKSGDTYYFKDGIGNYLFNPSNGNIGLISILSSACYWNVEVIEGVAILRNGDYQAMVYDFGYGPMFIGMNYTQPFNDNYHHLQFYRYSESSNTFYAHNPGCGSTANMPKILPVSEPGGLFLNPVTVTITTTTTGATIRYTTDGSAPTENSPAYNGPFVLESNTTVKARAFKNNLSPSAVAVQEYTFPTTYTSIMAFKNNAASTNAVARISSQMSVTERYGKTLYLSDATGGLLVYDEYGLLSGTYSEGDIISTITGRYASESGQSMMKTFVDAQVTEHAEPIQPTALTISALNNNYNLHESKLVKVEQVTLGREVVNGFDTLTFLQGSATMQAMNLFQGVTASYDPTQTYDIVGILGKEDGLKYVFPRRNNDIRPYHTITCMNAEHGSISAPASAGYLSLVPVTINAANNYHAATLYYYTTNPSVTTPIDPFNPVFEMPNANVTVVATFEPDMVYTVTFEAGTGSCATTSITEIGYHQGVTLPTATPSPNCTNEGYTFAGWSPEFVDETMIIPTLFEAGTVYYPEDNCTLYAVYTLDREGWEEVTETANLKEGYYVFAAKVGNILFYLPHTGVVSSTPSANSMTVNNGVPSATDMWKLEKNSASEFIISYTEDNTTYYLKSVSNSNQGIGVSTTAPSHGWSFIDHETKGLQATTTQDNKGDRVVRYIEMIKKTNFSGEWYFRAINNVGSRLYLYLSPSSLYATAPECPMNVATPVFVDAPEGLIFEESFMVDITCATPDASIYYTVNGDEPTNASTPYTQPFAINEDCTIKAIAYVGTDDHSLVATQVFDFARQFATIAEFKAAYTQTNTEEAIITGDIQFVFRSGDRIYVCDATAGLLVRDDNNLFPNTYFEGDVIQGGLVGQYLKQGGQPMMVPTYSPAAGIPGPEITPIVISTMDLAGDYNQYDARLITLSEATFDANYNFATTNTGFGIDNIGVKVVDRFETLSLSGNAGDRYDITGFGGKVSNNTSLFPRYDNDFNRYYSLTLGTTQHGTINASAAYAHAEETIILTAHPETGYELDSWSVTNSQGHLVMMDDENSFTMPADNVNIGATFTLCNYTVNVVASPETGGTVTGGGTGFHYNDLVQVTAVANPNFEFDRWVVPGQSSVYYITETSFTVTGNMTITAVFNPTLPSYHIYLYADPQEGGTVTGAGEYLQGSTVTISATPNEGYEFLNWTASNGQVVSTEPEYTFTVNTIEAYTAHFLVPVTDQTTTVNSGWNWYSCYIAYDDNSLPAIEDSIAAHTATAMIKSQTTYLSLADGIWDGELEELDNTKMYMINSGNSFPLTVSGEPVDPTATPIQLGMGWNWISFLSSEAMSLTDAMANLTPAEGDMIKGQSEYSSYSSALGWDGGLEVMVPGQGYLYLSNSEATKQLVYPVATRTNVVVTPKETYWSTDVHHFATNMSMMVTLDASRFNLGEGSHEIGAFVGNDCRGAARLQQVGNQLIAFLSVSGMNGEEVHFDLYDVTDGSVYSSADERVTYASNAVFGSMASPMTLHFGGACVAETDAHISLFPNPAKDQVKVYGASIEEVRVYDLLGQLVLAKSFAGNEEVTLDLSALTAGVYTLVLRTEGSVVTRKIVKE